MKIGIFQILECFSLRVPMKESRKGTLEICQSFLRRRTFYEQGNPIINGNSREWSVIGVPGQQPT